MFLEIGAEDILDQHVVTEIDDQITAVASIAEPQRRALYRHVAASTNPVSKDEAAAALGVARSVAAFHLDRLVADGLLEATFQRRNGRTGPGAGRPAKLYRRVSREVAVSLPVRRYNLAADLLAAAVSKSMVSQLPPDRTLAAAARRYGRGLGETVAERLGPDAEPVKVRNALVQLLADHGYEPRRHDGDVVLANCPFHALVDDYRKLVCTMNLDLLSAAASALPGQPLRPRLEPTAGYCCVRLAPEN